MRECETIAGFPVERHEIELGEVRVSLWAVRRLEDYLDTQALLADADAPEPPYWAHLWTGARALARRIATAIDCRGTRVLDVGCGLGLTSIVAAKRGARALAFDLDPHGVAFARANAKLNAVDVEVIQADLRELRPPALVDYVFAADVTYDPTLQVALAALLQRSLAPGGQAWCAESVRTLDTGLQRAAAERGLEVAEEEAWERDEGRDVCVRMIRLERPRL